MRLASLSIKALPGIAAEFTFQPPSPGVNIVTGPNAIGKSSLARALKHLLQPERSDPPSLSLEAELISGDVRWRVRRIGRDVAWSQEGESSDPPKTVLFSLHRFGMEQLLEADDDDADLAKTLRQQLRGGFDLDAPLASPLPSGLTSQFARQEEKSLRTAVENVRRIERNYEQLGKEEARLPGLAKRAERAKEAEATQKRLQAALDLAQALRTRTMRAEELATFPAKMDRLAGDEVEALGKLEERLKRLKDERKDQQRELEAGQSALAHTGLGQSRPKAEEIDGAESRLQAIDKSTDKRCEVQADIAAAAKAKEDALAQFTDAIDDLDLPGQPPRLNAEHVKRCKAIVEPLLTQTTKRNALQEQRTLAGAPPDQAEVDRLRRGAEALRTWLAAEAVESENDARNGAQRTSMFTWLALAGAAWAALAAILQGAWWISAGALLAMAALLLTWRNQRSTPAAPSSATNAKQGFLDTGLPPPDWRRERVADHLHRNIEAGLNRLSLQQERAANAATLALQIQQANEQIEGLESQRRAFAKECGFDPNLPLLSFHRFVDVSAQWDQARRRHEELEARLAHLQGAIEEAAKEVCRFLAAWLGANVPVSETDPELLRGAFNRLKNNVAAADGAQRRIEASTEKIKSRTARIDQAEKDIEDLFGKAGLSIDDRQALVERVDRIGAWRRAKHNLEEAEFKAKLLRDQMTDASELIEQAEEGAVEKLREHHESALGEAQKYDSWVKEQTEIETRLREAGKDQALEHAQRAETQARAALEDKLHLALLHEATGFLLAEVDQAFKSEHEPAVLGRAKKLFAEITAQEFALELDKDGNFAARDNRQQALRPLGELSCGTRMQVLLALRLAWIEAQEQGKKPLPLFLDEALTTSDEARFKVMAQSLERLAEAQGRQIFYLSARRHESALWKQATGNEPSVIDLAALRFGPDRASPKDFKVETPPPVPSPNGRSPEEYAAAIKVPRMEPQLPAGSIHPFHLLRDDLNLLHHLMRDWRIGSLGQLKALLNTNSALGAIAAPEVRRRLKQRCATAGDWLELWRQGRGRPVDRGVLEQSNAVSSNFIDRATQLAEAKQGDGAALVQALRRGELPGFRSAKTDVLEQWLLDEEYIDPRPILSAEDRCRKCVEMAAPNSPEEAADVNQLLSWLEGGTSGNS